MKKSLLLALLLLCMGTARPASDSTARQIMDHLYMSNGVPIQDLMLEADCSGLPDNQVGGNLQPLSHDKIFFKRPNKLRDDAMIIAPGSILDGTTRVVIRDGENVWIYTSLSPDPAKHLSDQPTGSVTVPYFLQHYEQDGDKEYKVIGHESVDGTPTTLIRITAPTSPPDVFKVWVDTKRWVPLKTEHLVPRKKEGTLLRRVVYKDIRKLTDGRWFPLHLEVYEDDVLVQVLVYRALSINTGLQDTLFEPEAKFMR